MERQLKPSQEIAKIVEQYAEGAITYAEMFRAIYLLLPPPCDDASKDIVYATLHFAVKHTVMAEKIEFERLGL